MKDTFHYYLEIASMKRKYKNWYCFETAHFQKCVWHLCVKNKSYAQEFLDCVLCFIFISMDMCIKPPLGFVVILESHQDSSHHLKKKKKKHYTVIITLMSTTVFCYFNISELKDSTFQLYICNNFSCTLF